MSEFPMFHSKQVILQGRMEEEASKNGVSVKGLADINTVHVGMLTI